MKASTQPDKSDDDRHHDNYSSIFLEISQDAMWLVDPNFCLIWGNKVFHNRLKEYFGSSLQPGESIIHPSLSHDEATQWENFYKRAFSGDRFTVELEAEVYQKSLITAYTFSKTAQPGNGSVCVAVIGKDITTTSRKIKDLQNSEKKYRAFVEQSKQAMFLHDTMGNIVDVNHATTQLTGYTREELLKMSVFDIDPDAVPRKDRDKIWANIMANHETTLEVRHRRRDGTTYPAEVIISKINFNHGDYILALAHDISQQTARREKLEDSLRFNTELIASMQEGFSVVDENGVHLLVNDALCKMTGYTKEELVGHGVPHKYWDPDCKACIENAFKDVKEGTLLTLELTFRHKNGRKIPVAVSPFVITGHDGKQMHFAATVKDISARKNYENILAIRLKLSEMKDQVPMDIFLTEALDKLEMVTGSSIGFFHFVDNDEHNIKLQTWSTKTKEHFCKAEGAGLHYPIGHAGVWADCIRFKKPIIHNDFKAVENKRGFPEGHAEVVRELTIPVIRNQRVVAVAGVGNKAVDYEPIDLENAQLICDLIWEMVETMSARQNLVTSEQQFRTLFENAPYGIYRTKADGEILMANPFLLRMLEFESLDELKSRSLQNEGFEDKSERNHFLDEMAKKGEVHNVESTWI
jgi:PAS domain S-box-containing protein